METPLEETSASHYTGVFDRIKAIMVDSVVFFALGLGATQLFEAIGDVGAGMRMVAFICIFILYDPLLTSLAGGTLGHHAIGIRVKRVDDESRKIIFPLAIIRFVLKIMLGWISLLTVSGNMKGRAIHDFVVGSVVVEK